MSLFIKKNLEGAPINMFSLIPAKLNTKLKAKNKRTTAVSHSVPEKLLSNYIMNKDMSSFKALYRYCGDDLYHYLLSLSDMPMAQDICQKVWLKVLENPQAFHTATSVKAWLFTMARNALIDEFRKQNRTSELDDSYLESSDNDVLEKSIDKESIAHSFDKALLDLPFKQKEAFCLQQEGFSIGEIAKMTDANPETIKTRLRYARTQLRKLLEKEDE